jgi:hypothetical protein
LGTGSGVKRYLKVTGKRIMGGLIGNEKSCTLLKIVAYSQYPVDAQYTKNGTRLSRPSFFSTFMYCIERRTGRRRTGRPQTTQLD